MRSGEARYRVPRTRAANDNRPRSVWRRLVAALVAAAFALMLVSLGFSRYAHHAATSLSHPVAFLTPN